MRKLLLLLFFIPLISFSQNKFNGAKYVYYENNEIIKSIKNIFKNKGFLEISEDDLSSLENPCEALIIRLKKQYDSTDKTYPYHHFYYVAGCGPMSEALGGRGKSSYPALSYITENISKGLRYYKFDSLKTPNNNKKYEDHFKINNEKSIREYLDNTGLDPIEGIWEYAAIDDTSPGSEYKLLILYEDYKYVAYIIDGTRVWRSGDKKAEFETAVSDEILTIKWTMADKTTVNKIVGSNKDNSIIEFNINGKTLLYKVFPKFGERRFKKGEWSGNGSGLIISKEGYIVTNHHVIDRASLLEVEFKNDDGVKKYKAEVINSDESTDLAILKIVDENFRGFDETPNYNFETELADVGNRVYAYGYPMALSIMGKEIKITDGLINSKTGYKGDVKTYQISAPIQGGNSGGPLFNEDGDFVGVNSSGLTKEVADNVGYSIKSNYVLNLINALPEKIELPYSYTISWLSTEKQIKRLSQYVVLVKVQR
jgi:S1-C subfamily serine protease